MVFRFSGYLFIVSFLFNFFWEISQMSFYKFEGMGDISNYSKFVEIHWIVSLKDALIVLCLYFIVGILMRNIYWGRKLNNKRLAVLLVLGGLWAIGIEYNAVIINHRWAYADIMPLLPLLNVGLLPVIQMMILPMLSIFLTRNQLKS